MSVVNYERELILKDVGINTDEINKVFKDAEVLTDYNFQIFHGE